MFDYLGVAIKQSFIEQDELKDIKIISTKKIGSWDFLLVSIEVEYLNDTIEELQERMINIETDCWYNHFFKDNKLIIVYQNKVFKVTTHPESWKEAVQYGLKHGIPSEQLDFKPRTIEDAYKFFGIEHGY